MSGEQGECEISTHVDKPLDIQELQFWRPLLQLLLLFCLQVLCTLSSSSVWHHMFYEWSLNLLSCFKQGTSLTLWGQQEIVTQVWFSGGSLLHVTQLRRSMTTVPPGLTTFGSPLQFALSRDCDEYLWAFQISSLLTSGLLDEDCDLLRATTWTARSWGAI